MGPQEFFHPDHVVPPAELIAALMKLPCRGIAQALVEAEAGQGEGLVLHLGQGDAGVAVEDVLGGEQGIQGPIQPAAQPPAPLVLPQVDGGLRGPLIGRPGVKGGGVGIAQQGPLRLRHQVGVGGQGVPHPLGELGRGGHGVLEGDGGVLHIGAVNGQQFPGVLRDRRAKVKGWHGKRPPARETMASMIAHPAGDGNGGT